MNELTLTPDQQARLVEAKRLSRLPYDGVVGTLPDWFPFADRGEFLRIRSRLLRECSPHAIQDMVQYLDGDLVPPDGFYVDIPRRLRPDLWRLLDYKRVFDLGPVEGLDLLLGKGIAGNARAGSLYLERCRRGGVKGGEYRRKEAAPEHMKMVRKARVLLQTKVSRLGLASRIKKSGSSYSTRQINNILKSEMK